MRVHQHISNNRVIGAPATWDQNELPCGALPTTDVQVNGYPALESYWKPSAEELAVLNNGGFVVLTVLGIVHPVVAIGTAI